MSDLHIFRAQALVEEDEEPKDGLTIHIVEPIPNLDLPMLDDWERASYARFREQGQALADVLVKYLPGGTIDQLLGALLQYRASHFVVPFEQRQPEVVTYPTTTDPDLADDGGAS